MNRIIPKRDESDSLRFGQARAALEHFQGLMRQHLRALVSIVCDNDRCLVSKILSDSTRLRARLFSAFLSHCLICDRYGRPGSCRQGRLAI
jgi:transposase